jgi:mannose-1-phosphate guanylyltransferase/phosphomannomutase
VKAIVMAGGKGTRMRPLTCELPKPMLPVMNKPVLEYILALLRKYEIRDIALTLSFLPQKIMDYFEDGSKLGLNLSYFIEDNPLGTAGSIRATGSFLDDTFVVISGDCITNVNLKEAITLHKSRNAAVTMILKKVDYPLDYGIAITNPEGYITEFVEKPSWGEVFSDTANTGIYIMEPRVLDLVGDGAPCDFSRDVFPTLLKKGHRIAAYVTNDYWNDIGGLDSYIRTHHDFFDRQIDLSLLERDLSKVTVGRNTTIEPSAIIRAPCLIGSNCRIGPNVLLDSYTVIGDNCIIEDDASIRRCILWNNCYVSNGVELRGSVIGRRAQIRHHVSTQENSVLGDETTIGERSIIKSNIKIWPRKFVEPQSVVDRSIIWANRLSRALFGQRGLSGVLNVDMTPEFATRLGSAYGTVIGKGASVVVSSDHTDSSKLFKLAFLSGLISVGVDAYDLSGMLIPFARKAVTGLYADGGIHIMQSLDSPDRLHVLFLDATGIEADRTLEKSIESAYFKEEFKRCGHKDLGCVVDVPDYCDSYTQTLMLRLELDAIAEARPKVCLCSTKKAVCAILEGMLTEMGCLVASQTIVDDFLPYLLMQEIDNENADLGCFVDGNGDKLILMDATGSIIRDDRLFMLTSSILFDKTPGFELLAPQHMTSKLELLAASKHGIVKRTKTGANNQMKTLIEKDGSLENSPQYWLQYDAIASLAFIIEYLCQDRSTLSEVMNQIPSYRVENTTIHCPWESMGKVMRLLIKESDGQNLNLMEGVKIYDSEAWALILPDAEQPILQIFAEGKNIRETRNILKRYTLMIENYIESGA